MDIKFEGSLDVKRVKAPATRMVVIILFFTQHQIDVVMGSFTSEILRVCLCVF